MRSFGARVSFETEPARSPESLISAKTQALVIQADSRPVPAGQAANALRQSTAPSKAEGFLLRREV